MLKGTGIWGPLPADMVWPGGATDYPECDGIYIRKALQCGTSGQYCEARLCCGGAKCCLEGTMCCGTQCCARQSCCGSTCCASGQQCCLGNAGGYCFSGTSCPDPLNPDAATDATNARQLTMAGWNKTVVAPSCEHLLHPMISDEHCIALVADVHPRFYGCRALL